MLGPALVYPLAVGTGRVRAADIPRLLEVFDGAPQASSASAFGTVYAKKPFMSSSEDGCLGNMN